MQKKILAIASVFLVTGIVLYVAYSLKPNAPTPQATRPPEAVILERATTDGTPAEETVSRAPSVLSKTEEATQTDTTIETKIPVVEENAPLYAVAETNSTPVAPVTAIAPSTTESLLISQEIVKNGRGFTGTVEAGHLLGFGKEDRSFTQFLIEARYRFNENHQVGIGQEAKKLYLIAPHGEKEFLLGDTLLSYEGLLSPDFLTLEWKIEASTTLPVSQYSHNVKNVTRPMVGLSLSRSLLNNLVTLTYRPALAYHFNSYATDPSGVPLTKLSIAQMAEGRVDIIPQLLHVSVWGQGFINFREQFDNSSSSPTPTTAFQYGSYVGIQITRQIGAQVGFVHGNTLISDFKYADNFYDAATSRYYAALRIDL